VDAAAPVDSYLVVDAIAAPDHVALSRFEESDSAFAFSPGWRGWANPDQSGGSAEITNAAGESAVFAFTGSTVEWIGQRGPTRAKAVVSIDGVDAGSVDTYASSYVSQQV